MYVYLSLVNSPYPFQSSINRTLSFESIAIHIESVDFYDIQVWLSFSPVVVVRTEVKKKKKQDAACKIFSKNGPQRLKDGQSTS